MKSTILKNKSLKKALQNAHFSREVPALEDQWKVQVMRRVREIGPPARVTGFWNGLESMLWRLAPVNAILIIPLILLFLNMDFDLGYDYLSNLSAEPETSSLSYLMGMEGLQ